jgi:hypothetical protein
MRTLSVPKLHAINLFRAVSVIVAMSPVAWE